MLSLITFANSLDPDQARQNVIVRKCACAVSYQPLLLERKMCFFTTPISVVCYCCLPLIAFSNSFDPDQAQQSRISLRCWRGKCYIFKGIFSLKIICQLLLVILLHEPSLLRRKLLYISFKKSQSSATSVVCQ